MVTNWLNDLKEVVSKPLFFSLMNDIAWLYFNRKSFYSETLWQFPLTTRVCCEATLWVMRSKCTTSTVQFLGPVSPGNVSIHHTSGNSIKSHKLLLVNLLGAEKGPGGLLAAVSSYPHVFKMRKVECVPHDVGYC